MCLPPTHPPTHLSPPTPPTHPPTLIRGGRRRRRREEEGSNPSTHLPTHPPSLPSLYESVWVRKDETPTYRGGGGGGGGGGEREGERRERRREEEEEKEEVEICVCWVEKTLPKEGRVGGWVGGWEEVYRSRAFGLFAS